MVNALRTFALRLVALADRLDGTTTNVVKGVTHGGVIAFPPGKVIFSSNRYAA